MTFLEQNKDLAKPQGSKLHQFKDDIILFKENGLPEKKILEYLSIHGVNVSSSWLNAYINKNLAGMIKSAKPSKAKLSKPTSGAAASVSTQSKAAAPSSATKPRDPTKPSWVPDHIDIDDLLSKS